MKRICLTLDLKSDPELIAAYEHYHSKAGIWPEIIPGILSSGISAMDIYRVENRLMMLLEMPDELALTDAFEKMRQMPRQTEWAALMAKFQQRLPFSKEGADWVVMKQIFQLN